MPDLRDTIRTDLGAMLDASSLRAASIRFLGTLGYASDKTLDLGGSAPEAFLSFLREHAGVECPFNEEKALVPDWKSADLLFQLTDDELSRQRTLFQETQVRPGLLRSYLFFAIELTGDNYARSKLTGIARQVNRVFPMPVMVLLKHRSNGQPVLSIAVINRRQSKRDAAKDVLGKVTIIRDISLADPHRGHLDILDSFARPNLVHPQRLPIADFDALHAAWEEIFNVELLNKRFYRELANWYFWALPQVEFPADIEPDAEKRRATGLIRLLTRLVFCWFLKEKGLVPGRLFVEAELNGILNDLSPDTSTFHEAILQNLFFATLNQRMGKDKNGQPYRQFAKDEGFRKNQATYGVDTLYRYESHFRHPENALDLFADVPFLNGGLFECLDRLDEDSGRKLYVDGFSRNPQKRPAIPNRLFLGGEHEEDLSEAYGDRKHRKEKVRGLLRILDGYKFTIVENTPIDQEIALDPELLGKVFENLLASYNEETKTTARKQTGSFYTPRPIVEYMVDESLKAHLSEALGRIGMAEEDAAVGLEILFAYTEREHPFTEAETDALLAAIHACKILDPACGSGAFPMGMLQKLVYIIHKLDPRNKKWKQLQIDAAAQIPDPSARDAAIQAIERDFADNEDDYGRKLYLIENCLYGVDIQPIAIQISKLRFFISLVCDQRTNRSKEQNLGVHPLPNLETKFVAANTLIALEESEGRQLLLADTRLPALERELADVRHRHFAAQRRREKIALQRNDAELRAKIAQVLADNGMSPKSARQIANWNPFDPQATSDFFDPHWMFGPSLAQGFDIIVQNPPYISHEKFTDSICSSVRSFQCWEPFADIYCYFLERTYQLLRDGGVSCSITSNSFLRSDYGFPLRVFLSNNCRVYSVLSIDRSQVFENAIVNVAITLFSKVRCQTSEDSYLVGRGEWESSCFADYIKSNTHFSRMESLHRRVWSLSTEKELEILRGIEGGNRSLSERGAKIRLGLATGANEAFLLTRSQVEAFAAAEPQCTNLIKPVIRGRDIDRYSIGEPDQFLILSKNGVDLPTDYPILAHHLEGFGEKFRNRGARGEYWWNLRSCSFYDDFEIDRVVWIELTSRPRFAVCPAGVYMLNSAYFLLPPDGYSANAIVAILNSSVARFFMEHNAQTSGMGVIRWFKEHVSEIPIPNVNNMALRVLDHLVHMRMFCDSLHEALFEALIDACVMECYFHRYMAERGLLFLDDLASHLSGYEPNITELERRDFSATLFRTLNSPTSEIRNRMLRIPADSPDLLAVIKEEGKA